MGGQQPPEWWREYRRRRADHLREYNRQRRQQPKLKAQRKASEKRRRAKRCLDEEPLPVLMPGLQHGSHYSFWEDELRLDLAQEAALAVLEGRCPEEAVKAYRAREYAWRRVTGPLVCEEHLEGSGGEGSLAR